MQSLGGKISAAHLVAELEDTTLLIRLPISALAKSQSAHSECLHPLYNIVFL